MNAGAPRNPLPLIDDPKAPEIYADDAAGFFAKQGNLSITLASARADHAPSGAVARVVTVGRVTMPIAAAQRLATGLLDFLKQQGVSLPASAAIRLQ